jgi:hypothetical protein
MGNPEEEERRSWGDEEGIMVSWKHVWQLRWRRGEEKTPY